MQGNKKMMSHNLHKIIKKQKQLFEIDIDNNHY